MKLTSLFLALLVVGSPLFAQNCQTASSVPADQKKVGAGSVTSDYSGTSAVKGGQAVYVKIKNENLTGVSYSLVVEEDSSPAVSNCAYKALLPPHTTAILWGSVFAEPPVHWKITIEIGSESDAGVLTYEIYSKPK